MSYTIDQLEYIVNTNTNLFTPNNQLTSGAICKLAGLTNRRKFSNYADEQAHNLKKMAFYVSLNKVLALRGLHIKSRNYYSEFHILPMNEVPARVKAYRQTSIAKLRRATSLHRGEVQHGGVWSSLSLVEKSSIT